MMTLLYGPNRYAVQQHVSEIIRSFKMAHGDASIERYDGDTLTPDKLPELLQGVSLFASDKLVIIRDVGHNKPLWEAVEAYAAIKDQTTSVVLVERDVDKRTKTFKTLQKHAKIVECSELGSSEIITWLIIQSKERLDRPLANLLLQKVGPDQQRLANELDKLLLHKNITKQHIDVLIEPSPEGSAFELLDAVFAGHHEKLGAIIKNVKLSEDPYRLFGLLISNVQVLAALVADTSKTPQQVASDVGVHPFVASKLSQTRRHTNIDTIRRTVKIMADTDTALKTTGHDPWILLHSALLKIATR